MLHDHTATKNRQQGFGSRRRLRLQLWADHLMRLRLLLRRCWLRAGVGFVCCSGGRAPVSVPSDPACVVALASAPAAGSHPVSGLGAGHKDQHGDFAMQLRASLWHDWQPVPTSELYVMMMDLEHVAADDVATTVLRRYSLPPRRQVGLRRRVSAFRLARRRAQEDVLAMQPYGDVDSNSANSSGPASHRLGNSS